MTDVRNHRVCTSVLASAQDDKLFKVVEAARKLNVKPLDELRFSLKCTHTMAYIVNLIDNTCTCSRFQLKYFPCEHTIALTMYRGFAARTLRSPDYKAEY